MAKELISECISDYLGQSKPASLFLCFTGHRFICVCESKRTAFIT